MEQEFTLAQINVEIAKLVEIKNRLLVDEETKKKAAKEQAVQRLGALVEGIKNFLAEAEDLCNEFGLSFSLADTSLSKENYGFGSLSYYGAGSYIDDSNVMRYRYGENEYVDTGSWRSSSDREC